MVGLVCLLVWYVGWFGLGLVWYVCWFGLVWFGMLVGLVWYVGWFGLVDWFG
jgi:hypothetical protein